MIYTRDNLRQIFQQPFNANEWQQMLQHYFHAKELKAEPEPINGTSEYEKGYYLGALDTSDSYRIGLFYYQIQHGNVARKRVGLRNLVKSFINPNWGEFDAALVVFDSGSVWRLSFVCDVKGENTAAKRFTYVFGESDNYYNTPVGRFDALQRNGISFENIKDAFSVERLNKDFFNGYKERYVKFLNHINEDTKENRDYVKKLLGRLVFLQFLQKKGWMGVPAIQQGWNGGDKFYLNHLIDSYEGNDRLLSDVLEPLFFNTLNERRGNDLADSRLGENIKIPYLNGGLFDKDDLDKKDIDFPYDYFKELMDFFAMYNFTIDENDPEDSEIGIDPEMLGHIFENLLEDNKDKGAFYTPKEIVQYMSKESVAQYLKSNTPEELHSAIDSLIKQRVVEPILQNKENARLVNKVLSVVKVCDPAIGSGAFPMGVLNVLFDCRHLLYGFIGKNEDFSYAKVKRDIIQNNIYGVDIEKGAVDIARLRFWLALVVDENEPQPLPNLDYKIMCGDSLLHRFALDAPFQNVLKDYNQKNGTQYTLDDYRQWVYDYTDISDHTQKDNFRQKIEDIKRAVKTELNDKEKGKIAKVRGAIANLQMGDFFGDKKKENERKIKALQKELKALEQQRAEIESNKIYDQAFEWRFEFPALLDENGNFMGFDIVIGNPPYIDIKRLPEKNVRLYFKLFTTTENRINLYSVFIEKGTTLLSSKGTLCFINPNSMLINESYLKLREFIIDNVDIIIKLPDTVFESATVETIILLLQKNNKKAYVNGAFFKKNDKINFAQLSFARFERNIWKTDKDKRFNIFSSPQVFSIINKIKKDSKNLGMFVLSSLGITPYDKYKGHDEKTIKERKFHAARKIDSTYVPLISGKNIHHFNITDDVTEYLKYGDWLGAPREKKFFENPKIIVRQILEGENQRIIAAYSEKPYYFTQIGFSLISPNGDKDMLKFITYILNSSLMSFYHRNVFLDIEKVVFQKILIANAKQLPIKGTERKSDVVKAFDSGQMSLATIDLLVYHLYGLTYDEVLIVDPETPIKREEYEKNIMS